MENQKGSLLYAALIAKYEAQVKEAVATLSIYFNSSVGIGEHPQHLEEMDKLVEQLANASDKIEKLSGYFESDGTANGKTDWVVSAKTGQKQNA